MKISICIPTYNRASYLANCLNSLISCRSWSKLNFEVCVSDNNSTDATEDVVRKAQSYIDIKYHKNIRNFGRVRNYLNVVTMADGDFIWLIGDDDLLIPHAIEALHKLIDDHSDVDFFYINSYHLTTEFIKHYPAPFDTVNLPSDMERFSKWTTSGEMPFFQLIDPKLSFDFLGGMFLSVFRKTNWMLNLSVLDENAIKDDRTFSHFDNTFPHVKIFAKAFCESKAYFNATPLSVCLTGAREWSPMNPLVMSVRLVESLQEYRNNGLPYWQYVNCKNYALNNFVPDFIQLLLHRNSSGYTYIRPVELLVDSCLYPNFYLSSLYFIGKRVRRIYQRIVNTLILTLRNFKL